MVLYLSLIVFLIAITCVTKGFDIKNDCGQTTGQQCGIGKVCSQDFSLSCDPGHVVVPLWGRHAYCGGNECCDDLSTFCRNMTDEEFNKYVGHCDPDSNVCYVSHRNDQLPEPACGCTENCNSRMSAIIYICDYVPTTAEPTVTTTSPDSPSTLSTTTLSTIETSTSLTTRATTTTITSTTTLTTILTQSTAEAISSTTIASTPQTTAKSTTDDRDLTTHENPKSTITLTSTTNGSSTSSTIALPITSPVDATKEATTHEDEPTTAEIGSSSTSTDDIFTTDERRTSTSHRSSLAPTTTATSTSPLPLWTTSGETTDLATTEGSPGGGDSGPLILVLGVLLLLVLILAVIAALCVYSRRKSAPSRSDSKTQLESGTSFVNEEYALSTKSPASGWPDVVPEKDAYRNIEKCPPHDEEGELEDYYGVAAAPHPGLVQQAERFQAVAGAGGAMDAGDGEDIFSVPPAGAAPGEDGDYGTYADTSGMMTDEYDYVTHEGSAQKQAKDTDGIEEDYYAVSQPTDPHHVQHPDRFQPTAASSSQVEQSEEYDYAYGHMLGGPMRMQEGTINPGRAIELKPDPASENPKQLETNETLMSENPVYG